MLYLNEGHLQKYGHNWTESIDVIERAVNCLNADDYVQPLKPYLRFRDFRNRIIAMPAYLGGEFHVAGIKWIASYPGNILKGLPRAHCVVVLNDADTGEPIAIINTGLLSIVRTASVSGFMIRCFDRARYKQEVVIGISGLGPIGLYHLKMCAWLFSGRISRVYIYDKREIDLSRVDPELRDKVIVAKNWQEAFVPADLFFTCTVSAQPYINECPKAGSLHLNVSLRDYMPEMFAFFKDATIVDDWNEVCREGTDIERMSLEKGLTKEMTRSIGDLTRSSFLEELAAESPVFFNPMGMAIFDMAIAQYYCEKEKVGEAEKTRKLYI
jgi:2,3-diaminopropionate biosynthesis protein SbnB